MAEKTIVSFIQRGEKDDRMKPAHVSLFVALFYCWIQNNYKPTFNISRAIIMKLAKIESTATYHKCLREMVAFGYLEYFPSYNPLNGSTFKLTI